MGDEIEDLKPDPKYGALFQNLHLPEPIQSLIMEIASLLMPLFEPDKIENTIRHPKEIAAKLAQDPKLEEILGPPWTPAPPTVDQPTGRDGR